jgi:hypothetical protein
MIILCEEFNFDDGIGCGYARFGTLSEYKIVRSYQLIAPIKFVMYLYVTVEVKAVPQHTYIDARGERRYSFYSLTTSAIDGGEWSASRPG